MKTIEDVLTPLDRKALEVFEDGKAHRLEDVVARVCGPYPIYGDRIKREQAAREREDVRQIVRGLAHLGMVRERRGGWWSKA